MNACNVAQASRLHGISWPKEERGAAGTAALVSVARNGLSRRSSAKAEVRTLPSRLRASAVMVLLFCLVAWGQDYAINWRTIDGGGGMSTAGVYSVSGTIGQPDANTPPGSGGSYTLTGGFWALHAVQVPGAPLLSITPAGSGLATVSWEPDSPRWVLQETLSLSPTNWVNSPSGTNNPVTVPAAGPTKFYRLKTQP